MALVDVLIPTCGRKTGLATVLASLVGQTFQDFNVVISDQTEDKPYLDSPEISTILAMMEWRGHEIRARSHLPRRGMAEQRNFLLEQSRAPYVYFLDDDVLLEPLVLERLVGVLRSEGCGFVGCAAASPFYLHDVRPHQQHIELWEGPVRPEPVTPDAIPRRRTALNVAANPLHLEEKLSRNGEVVRYKVAWVGGASVLYDRQKLLDVGGFSWWDRLPPEHAGEEVLTQFLLLRKYGGCGILPTGTYHLLAPTTIPNRSRDATELFGQLIEDFDVHPVGQIEPLPEYSDNP